MAECISLSVKIWTLGTGLRPSAQYDHSSTIPTPLDVMKIPGGNELIHEFVASVIIVFAE